MNLITLSPWDLGWAALAVLVLAAISLREGLGIERTLLVAAVRMAVQLILVGYVLKALFTTVNPWLIGALALAMVGMAGYEVRARLKRKLVGPWGRWLATGPLFLSSFAVTLFALLAVVGAEPWYHPRYAIPLLGMMLGNGMSGVALVLNHLLATVPARRDEIEQRLMLGETRDQAMHDIRREAMHAATIPLINAMTAAGIISLPGVMTGQILAGAPPVEAVRFQLLIMFLIAAGSGFAQVMALKLTVARLFDARGRLRLDRMG
ncbi:MAG: iron export ABC transporter permease subunit FetB [Nitrospirota bacterium]|nr:iron export ABC transporter permease subunit FetB [Nitrospirota bacterium]